MYFALFSQLTAVIKWVQLKTYDETSKTNFLKLPIIHHKFFYEYLSSVCVCVCVKFNRKKL